MDLLTPANALATIVQLLGVFAQERQTAKDASHQEFIEWLQYHKHEQLVSLISNTAAIQSEVAALLKEDRAELKAKLEAIDTTLATILSRVQGFGALALTIAPNSALSEQAIFRAAPVGPVKIALTLPDLWRRPASSNLRRALCLQYHDARFLADDLDTLLSLWVARPGTRRGR
jgi:ABC-type transporter Mla subunit MlaD